MRFSREFIERVEQATDIVAVISERGVALKRAGANYKGLCPFHGEKTPSFNVNPQKGFYYCFGCGAGGNAIKFLMQYERITFVEAVKDLAHRFAIPLENEPASKSNQQNDRILQCLQATAIFYHAFLVQNPSAEVARSYLHQRKVPESTWKTFQLGFAPDDWQTLFLHLTSQGFSQNELAAAGLVKFSPKSGRPYDTFRNRIIFPIRDRRGRSIAFGGRAIAVDQQPKYLNSPETQYYQKSKVLYGFYEGLESIRQTRQAILVEGYLDVTRLHEFGFAQAIATCGTSLTMQHIHSMQQYNMVEHVVLLLDGDQAGQKAALRSCPLFLAANMEASIAILPANEDPDTFLLNQGAENFSRLLKQNTRVFEFLVQQSLAKYNPNVQGRTKALEELLPIIAQIQRSDLQQMTLVHLAEMIHLPIPAVMELASKALQNSMSYDRLQNFRLANSSSESDPHEQFVLQALLKSRSLMQIARKYLDPNELNTPHLRQIYEGLLQFTDEEFQTLAIEDFGRYTPEIQPQIMDLYLDDTTLGNEEQFKMSLRRLKERNLKFQFTEKRAIAQTEEEILRLSVEERKQQAALDEFFPITSTPRRKFL